MEAEIREPSSQAELSRFRDEWLSEVAKTKRADASAGNVESERKLERRRDARAPINAVADTARRKDDFSEDFEPRAYHDLPDREAALQLGSDGQRHDRAPMKEPSSALEHYEHAVEKETQGQLGASITHYRKAFKLDDGVQEIYKKKHFPPSSFVKSKPSDSKPSNAAVTVPGTGHHSLHGSANVIPSSLQQLLDEFSELRIEPAPPATSLSPQKPSPLGELPEEILNQIMASLGAIDMAGLGRMAQVSKRLAFLIMTDQSVWKRVAMGSEVGFAAMHYDYMCDIAGFSLEANNEIAKYLGSYDETDGDEEVIPEVETPRPSFLTLSEDLLRSTYASSWRQMQRTRPRIRFNGCYISTVNYSRPGATSTNTLYWGAPVHVVTYFRYLRFFRDGTVISLLTTSEPADVVHYLTKDNVHDRHGAILPTRVMKDALVGRWRLSGPASSTFDPATNAPEAEGDVHVETEGVVPKYFYKMLLALANAGKGARNNKLAWKGFWSYNRMTDDWGEFGLKNDRAFYWSRVRSYGMGYET